MFNVIHWIKGAVLLIKSKHAHREVVNQILPFWKVLLLLKFSVPWNKTVLSFKPSWQPLLLSSCLYMKVFTLGRDLRKTIACCDSKNKVNHQEYRWKKFTKSLSSSHCTMIRNRICNGIFCFDFKVAWSESAVFFTWICCFACQKDYLMRSLKFQLWISCSKSQFTYAICNHVLLLPNILTYNGLEFFLHKSI